MTLDKRVNSPFSVWEQRLPTFQAGLGILLVSLVLCVLWLLAFANFAYLASRLGFRLPGLVTFSLRTLENLISLSLPQFPLLLNGDNIVFASRVAVSIPPVLIRRGFKTAPGLSSVLQKRDWIPSGPCCIYPVLSLSSCRGNDR